MPGEFETSEGDLGLKDEDKKIDNPFQQEAKQTAVEQKPEFSEASKAIYSNLLSEERRVIREMDPEGIKGPGGSRFVGIELLVPVTDEEGFETGTEKPISSSDEQNLTFPSGFSLKFLDGNGKEVDFRPRIYTETLAADFAKYTSLVDRLENTRNLNLNEDELLAMHYGLETQRAAIHNKAAGQIADALLKRGSRDSIDTSLKNAKTLFELMYLIENSSEGSAFDLPTVDQLKPEALKALREHLREETGCDIIARPSVHFHADEREGWVSYNVKLLGDEARSKLPQAEELFSGFIDKLHSESPESFKEVTREVLDKEDDDTSIEELISRMEEYDK
jgi:hypothetical protein